MKIVKKNNKTKGVIIGIIILAAIVATIIILVTNFIKKPSTESAQTVINNIEQNALPYKVFYVEKQGCDDCNALKEQNIHEKLESEFRAESISDDEFMKMLKTANINAALSDVPAIAVIYKDADGSLQAMIRTAYERTENSVTLNSSSYEDVKAFISSFH